VKKQQTPAKGGNKKVDILIIVPDNYFEKGTIFNIHDIIKASIKPQLDQYAVNPKKMTIVSKMDTYLAMPPKQRYRFDIILTQMGSIGPAVIDDQAKNSKNLKWVHSVSAGIDGIVSSEAFRKSSIPLTNAKGAYSHVLGEFIALGVLYHTKHVERFTQRKKACKFEREPMHQVCDKHMAIIGYGDIGASCARICKNGFDMKITGVKRNPTDVSKEHRSYCDEIVGND